MVEDQITIHNQIDRLTIHGQQIPKKINEISELTAHFGGYNHLINDVENGHWQILLPNHSLHTNYDLVTSKNIQKIDSRISFVFMIFIPICLTIYGLFSGNYLLLISLGIPIFSTYLNGFLNLFLKGNFVYMILFFSSILGFVKNNLSVGFLFALSFLSLIVNEYIRNHRRKYTIFNCMNDEYIFCYLFFSGTISLYNSNDDIFVRRQFN